jgi:hypothetical protein
MDGLSVYLNFYIRGNPVLNIETWASVQNLPYSISTLGNVKRSADVPYKHKNKEFVKPYLNNKGYISINLYKNSKVHRYSIHRLIAIAFIPNPNNFPEVNHIDGNPLNNGIDNLEWCTHQHNMQHAWDTGLHKNRHSNASVKRKISTSKYIGVSWSEQRKRWCVYVRFDNKRYGVGRFINELDAAIAHDNFIKEMDLLTKGYKLNFN